MSKKEDIVLIAEKIFAHLTPRCSECGSKLSPYWFYTEYYQVQICDECGHINRKRRK